MRDLIKTLKLYMLPAIMLAVYSCTFESPQQTIPSTQDDTDVVMSLNAPSGSGTRSLSDAQEDAINNVDVLVFDRDEKFCYTRSGQVLRDADGDVYFRAKLRASQNEEDKFRIVLIANGGDLVNSLFSDSQHIGSLYADVIKLLICNLPVDPNPQTNSSLSGKGIPMWGEVSGKVRINYSGNAMAATMLRALARIDIITNPMVPVPVDANGRVTAYMELDNFSLEEAYVYKGNGNLRIIPEEGAYDFVNKLPINVTIPSSPTVLQDKLTYIGEGNGIVRGPVNGNGMAMTNMIYVAESDVNGPSGTGVYADAQHTGRMAIVVGGKYEGNADVTYYRIDFRTAQQSTALYDVLRNHNYQLVINKVKSKGHSTPDEAYNSVESRIEATITDWQDAGQKVIFDGQHRMILSHDGLVVGSHGSNYFTNFMISVRSTNVDEPLSITGPHYTDGSNWLLNQGVMVAEVAFDNELGVAVRPGFIHLGSSGDSGAVMENATGSPREVYYLITSGNLTYKFRILQSGSPWIEVNLDNPYLFNSSLHRFSVNALCNWNVAVAAGYGNNTSNGISPLMQLRSVNGPAGTDVPGTFSSYDDTPNNPRLLSAENVRVLFSDPAGINVTLPAIVNFVSPGVGVAPTMIPEAAYLSYKAGSNSPATVTNPSGLMWTLSVGPGQDWLRLADLSSGNGATTAKASSAASASYSLYAVSENTQPTMRSTTVTLKCEGYADVVMPVHQTAGVVPHLAVLDPDHIFSLDGTAQTATVEYDHSWKISAVSANASESISNVSTLLAKTQAYTGSGANQTTTLSLSFKDLITGMVPGDTPVNKTFTITFAHRDTGQTVYVWEVKAEAIPKAIPGWKLKVYPVDLIYSYGTYGWYDYSNTKDGVVDRLVPPNNTQVTPPRENSCAALYPQNTWRLPTSAEWRAVCDYIVANEGPARFNIPVNSSNSNYYFSATTDTDVSKVEATFFNYNTSTGKMTYGQSGYMKNSKTTNGRGRCVRDF